MINEFSLERSYNLSGHGLNRAGFLHDRWIRSNFSTTPKNSDGLIIISYLKDKMIVFNRVQLIDGIFEIQKKLVYYLTHTKGRIVASVIMSLLEVNDGSEFSTYQLTDQIDRNFFIPYDENVSSAVINDTIKRMLKSTLNGFFELNGKYIHRKNFSVIVQELNHKMGKDADFHHFKLRIEMFVDKIVPKRLP